MMISSPQRPRKLVVIAGVSASHMLVSQISAVSARIHERSVLSIQVSLTSPRPDLLRRLEPWAPPPDVRVEVLRRLCAAGLRAGLSLSPILPGLTDRESDLDELIGTVKAAGVQRMWCSLLFLRSPTREKFFDFLSSEFPQYLEAYRRAYAGRSSLTGRYKERVHAMVQRLREKHGLNREAAAEGGAYARRPEQLGLFAEPPGDARGRATFGYRLLS
jgi:DNA repair photolyase